MKRRTPRGGSDRALADRAFDVERSSSGDWDPQRKAGASGRGTFEARGAGLARSGPSVMELFRSEEMQLCQVRGGCWGRPMPQGAARSGWIAAHRAGGGGARAAGGRLAVLSRHANLLAAVCLQLMIPAEAAHDTITALGEVGMLQFKDLNAERTAFQRTYANQVRGAPCARWLRRPHRGSAAGSCCAGAADRGAAAPIAPLCGV